MSLVADYSSDVSNSDEEILSTEISREAPENTISSLLPPPKTLSKSKKEGPVKIVVDLPQISQIDLEEENVSKKPKTSSSKNSLFALLPAPKRTITNERRPNDNGSTTQAALKTTNFMPHAITRKKPAIQTKSDNSLGSEFKQLTTRIEDNTGDINTITESFFPLGPEITNIKSINETKDASTTFFTTRDNVESYASAGASSATDSPFPTDGYTYNEYNKYHNDGQWQENANTYVEYQEIYDEPQGSEQTQLNWELDDEMFQKLGGRRGKREGPIKIKEINAADQMADSWQSQVANLSKPTRGPSEGSARLKPTRGQKRRHNLMYLAFHATSMESELKEQHASNKKTKRETQAKY
ncbi:2086_t:CDS:2, partial [Cetraspora pellucida]